MHQMLIIKWCGDMQHSPVLFNYICNYNIYSTLTNIYNYKSQDGDVWQVRWLRGDGYNYSCQGDSECLGVCINSSSHCIMQNHQPLLLKVIGL